MPHTFSCRLIFHRFLPNDTTLWSGRVRVKHNRSKRISPQRKIRGSDNSFQIVCHVAAQQRAESAYALLGRHNTELISTFVNTRGGDLSYFVVSVRTHKFTKSTRSPNIRVGDFRNSSKQPEVAQQRCCTLAVQTFHQSTRPPATTT